MVHIKEWYTIAVKANNIILSGNSDSLQSFYASTIFNNSLNN